MPHLCTVQCATTVSIVNKACCNPIFATLWSQPCVCADKPLPVCVREMGPQSICGCSVQVERMTAVTTGEILTLSTGRSLRRSRRGRHRGRFLHPEKNNRVSVRERGRNHVTALYSILFWFGKPVITKTQFKAPCQSESRGFIWIMALLIQITHKMYTYSFHLKALRFKNTPSFISLFT